LRYITLHVFLRLPFNDKFQQVYFQSYLSQQPNLDLDLGQFLCPRIPAMSSNTSKKAETAFDVESISTSSVLSQKERAQNEFAGNKQSKTSRLLQSEYFRPALKHN
jgi:hypothetical protein